MTLLLPPFLLTLLAELSPPPAADPASFQSVGWLLLALASLAGGANQIMGLVAKFRDLRTQSPGEVSADRVKALEDRMHAMEITVATSMGGITTQVENIKASLTHIVSDFNYAIGRIDGRNESGPLNGPTGL